MAVTIANTLDTFSTVSSVVYYTDDFEAYTAGDANLHAQGNWLRVISEIYVVDVAGDNRIYCEGETGYRRSEVVDDDQYAQIKIDTLVAGSQVGPAVRMSGSGVTACYFGYYSGPSSGALFYVLNGSWTTITDIAGVLAGTVLKLKVVGSNLYCYQDGSLDTQIGGGTGIYDASVFITANPQFASGSVGISGWNGCQADDWEGGNA